MEPLIFMQGVTKHYGSLKAIDAVTMAVSQGEILGLLGPNGSGKTTTVRLLNGVIFPDEGTIGVKGLDTVRDGGKIRAFSGVLTETAALYDNMTAGENLRFFGDLYGVPADEIKKRTELLLHQFGLDDRRSHRVGTFSTGLKKRLGIVKAMIHQPEILYLDEPASGLDPESAQELLQYIRQLNEDRLTVVICTHNLPQAQRICSRFAFLDKGRIIESGTLAELKEKYAGAVRLRIDYSGALGEALPHSIGLEALPPEGDLRSAVLTVPSREQVPGLIRTLSAAADLYRAEPLDIGLEDLYFAIRRKLP